MAKAAVKLLFPNTDQQDELESLDTHYTDELVIGLVGPIGSGVTRTATLLKHIFERTYKYATSHIRVSEIIANSAMVVGEQCPASLGGHERVIALQTIGSKLRENISESYLAEKCVEKIAIDRHAHGGYRQHDANLVPMPRRYVHIIDSLKNPAEVRLLQDVYGKIFWLFGVFAPEEVRKSRLLAKGMDGIELQKILNTDEEEGVDHGQKVRETIEQADFFIRNDGENEDRLRQVLDRYLSILFNLSIQTPTLDEAAMYTAASAAASSACLSRQVGAAIYTSSGELIGKGSNDVPKKGGGLYSVECRALDHRCYKWQGQICHNDDRKSKLYQEIFRSLNKNSIINSGIEVDDVIDALKQTDIRNLIEYSRAVHAEMEAIMSVARGHKFGIVGSTMYCTTFPCHNCARHILASGIEKVVYIEPYPKSLALTLHKDAISIRESDQSSHVLFLQYEGVAPKNIVRLFKFEDKRKADGRAIKRDPEEASPVSRTPLDGFSAREQIVTKRIEQVKAKHKIILEIARGISNETN